MKKTEGIFCPPDQNVKAVEIYVVLVWVTLYNSYIRVFDDVKSISIGLNETSGPL